MLTDILPFLCHMQQIYQPRLPTSPPYRSGMVSLRSDLIRGGCGLNPSWLRYLWSVELRGILFYFHMTRGCLVRSTGVVSPSPLAELFTAFQRVACVAVPHRSLNGECSPLPHFLLYRLHQPQLCHGLRRTPLGVQLVAVPSPPSVRCEAT